MTELGTRHDYLDQIRHRAELPEQARRISTALDEWRDRVHGVIAASSHDVGLLLDLLEREGLAVVDRTAHCWCEGVGERDDDEGLGRKPVETITPQGSDTR